MISTELVLFEYFHKYCNTLIKPPFRPYEPKIFPEQRGDLSRFTMELIFLTIILGATILLAFYITQIFKSKAASTVEEEGSKEAEDEEVTTSKESSAGKTKKKVVDKRQKEKNFTFQHPWLLSTLKGHSGRVLGKFSDLISILLIFIHNEDLDLSANGKHLASCAEDRTVLVWNSKDFNAKEHKCLRCNVDYDHGIFIQWSPDCKAFAVQKAVHNSIEVRQYDPLSLFSSVSAPKVYKMGKKPDGSLGDFSVAVSFPAHHKTDTIGMGISPSGKFIASCNDKTELIIWNLKGDILEKIGQFQFNLI